MHRKAVPVILTTADEVERWLAAPEAKALDLQCPLPDGALAIAARGERERAAPGPTLANHD